MRAIRRYFLASLVMAAATLCVGSPTHFAAASAAHPSINKVVYMNCPAGTNWDDGAQTCL
jgi:hypothetical protein